MSKPGAVCTYPHTREQCYVRRDDLWLDKHPDKTGIDLPSWKHIDAEKRTPGANAVEQNSFDEDDEFNDAADNVDDHIITVSNAECEKDAFMMYTCAAPKESSRSITLTLDSGATVTCLKQGHVYPLERPVTIHAAGKDMSVVAKHGARLPFPSMPGGVIQGVYTPQFRHNLVAVRTLQKKGLQVTFPASSTDAVCTTKQGQTI